MENATVTTITRTRHLNRDYWNAKLRRMYRVLPRMAKGRQPQPKAGLALRSLHSERLWNL